MGNRIDDLEKNIADLMTQAGVEGGDKWTRPFLSTLILSNNLSIAILIVVEKNEMYTDSEKSILLLQCKK